MRRVFTWLLMFAAVFGLGIGAAYAAGYGVGRATAPAATPVAQSSGGAAGQGGQGTAVAGARGQAGGAQSGDQAQGGQANRQGGQGSAAGTVVGTVQSMEGNTLKVAAPGGNETTVTLSDTTRIGTVNASDSGAVSQGSTVLLLGQRGQDGSFTPTSVIVLPAGFTGR